MKKINLVLLFLNVINLSMAQKISNKGILAPSAEKRPHDITIHNHTRTDNYYWLNQREDPEVLKYLNAENEYLEAVMKPIADQREALFEEMKARIKEKDESVPYKDGSFYYYSKFVEAIMFFLSL